MPPNGQIFLGPTRKHFRCGKGHEWSETAVGDGHSKVTFVQAGKIVAAFGPVCFRCLAAALQAQYGGCLAEEVSTGTAESRVPERGA